MIPMKSAMRMPTSGRSNWPGPRVSRPLRGLTLGNLIFNWRTVVPPATNAPAGL